jgi:hypothetical protein
VSNRHAFSGAAGRNHSYVANQGVAATVLPRIPDVESERGDMKP